MNIIQFFQIRQYEEHTLSVLPTKFPVRTLTVVHFLTATSLFTPCNCVHRGCLSLSGAEGAKKVKTHEPTTQICEKNNFPIKYQLKLPQKCWPTAVRPAKTHHNNVQAHCTSSNQELWHPNHPEKIG